MPICFSHGNLRLGNCLKILRIFSGSRVENFFPTACMRAVHNERGQGGATALIEKTIFTIFRMTLLIILWIFGTFFGI